MYIYVNIWGRKKDVDLIYLHTIKQHICIFYIDKRLSFTRRNTNQ